MPDSAFVYKICAHRAWQEAIVEGCFRGSADDLRDGYIHLSTAEQLPGTAARHFRGQSDLLLISIETSKLAADLKWEPSRGGALFPHLYGPLDVSAAISVQPLVLSADGVPIIPEDLG